MKGLTKQQKKELFLNQSRDFSRPSEVLLASTEIRWPQEALACLSEGFRVRLVNDATFERQEIADPVCAYTSKEPEDFLPMETQTLHLERVAFLYTLGVGVKDRIGWPGAVGAIRRLLRAKGINELLIHANSDKIIRETMLYPRWTLWFSFRYWINVLLKRKMNWGRNPGERFFRTTTSIRAATF